MIKWEDSQQYQLCFQHGERLLRHALANEGQSVPKLLIAQINADWTATLRRSHKAWTDRAVLDVERRLDDRKDLRIPMPFFKKIVRISAFLPSPQIMSALWSIVLQRLDTKSILGGST